MQQIAQGGTVTLTSVYETGSGDLVDPTTPTIDIIDADGDQLVTDATPTHISLGNYSYAYVVPADGALGVWQAHWSGVIDGLTSGGDDFFDVVTPGAILTSTYDLLTLDEAKAALNIPLADTTFDTELASYITAVSQRLDDLCGPIVKRSVSDEIHDGNVAWILPDFSPVASVGSVTEYSNGTGTVLTAESLSVAGDYTLEGAGTHGAILQRRASFSDRAFSYGPVVVNYVAGRFNSTAAVSPKFKQAAAKMLSHMWRGDQGAGSATFGAPTETPLLGYGFAIPNAVVELLAEERKPPVLA